MSNQLEKVKELIELRAKARLGGGEKAIEKQHAKGKRNGYVRETPLHQFRYGEETISGRRGRNRIWNH